MTELTISSKIKIELWLTVVLCGLLSSALSFYCLYKYAEDLFYNSPIYEIKMIGLTVSTVILSVGIVLQCTIPLLFVYFSFFSYQIDSLSGRGKMSNTSKVFSTLTVLSFVSVFVTFSYYHI